MKPAHHGLVREVRTDRDGVQRARWVRPGAAPAAAARAIPAPVAHAPLPAAEHPMDQPRPLLFERVGYSALGAALDRRFGEDDGTDHVEVTDRLWYEAKRAGLADMQLRAFLRAGFTDVPAMVEYAQRCRDREFSKRNLPGIAAHRAKWVTALMEASVSREAFAEANRNVGTRVSLESLLMDRDSTADPVDIVRICAATPDAAKVLPVVGLMQTTGLTYDDVQAIGVTRVIRHADLFEWESSKDDVVAAIFYDKGRRSLLTGSEKTRVAHRLKAISAFGLDRALQLREPGLIAPQGRFIPLDSTWLSLPADVRFEQAKFLDAVLDASVRSGTATGPSSVELDIARSPEYRHLGKVRRARIPHREETYPYFKAGLTPAETARALEDGISPQAALGMYREGINAPVADGWL